MAEKSDEQSRIEDIQAASALEAILAAPRSTPRYYPLGTDALAAVHAYVTEAVESFENAAPGEEVDDLRGRAASRATEALDWLLAAKLAGLLRDCSAQDLSLAEEEWACTETAYQR